MASDEVITTVETFPDAPEEGNEIPVPEGAENITPDGAVRKVTTSPGHGELPPLHSRCLVHYIGRLLDSGSVFMDSKQESQSEAPVAITAGRDAVTRELGLNLVVATMKVGERATAYVLDPKYGYGEKGSFSFPCVPPNAKLVYDIELVEFEPPGEANDSRGMMYEERLEAAERRRKDGNTLFQEGQYKEALGKYTLALSFVDDDFLMQLDGFYLDKAHAVKIPIHLNMAACHLQTGDFDSAIYNCKEVLNIEPDNVKALFRRGRARHLLGQTDSALEDLQAAHNKSPEDKAVLRELQAARATLKEERKAAAALFKGTLRPTPGAAAEGGADATSSGGAVSGGMAARAAPAATAGGGPVVAALTWLVMWVYGVAGWLAAWLRLLTGRRQ